MFGGLLLALGLWVCGVEALRASLLSSRLSAFDVFEFPASVHNSSKEAVIHLFGDRHRFSARFRTRSLVVVIVAVMKVWL